MTPPPLPPGNRGITEVGSPKVGPTYRHNRHYRHNRGSCGRQGRFPSDGVESHTVTYRHQTVTQPSLSPSGPDVKEIGRCGQVKPLVPAR